jgi:hypothetical protein
MRSTLIFFAATGLLAATGCDVSRTAADSVAAANTPSVRPDTTATGFSRKLAQGGYSFDLKTTVGPDPALTIRTRRGISQVVEPLRIPLTGQPVRAAAADLNGNGKPEVYVFTDAPSANGGFYGYELQPSGLTPLPGPGRIIGRAAEGYRGHDTYAVSGATLIRSFPLGGDVDTAGSRTLAYRLLPGNTWKVQQVMEGNR